MPVDGVAAAEDAALGVLGGPGLVDLPGGDVLDLDLDVRVADHLADAGQDGLGTQVGFGAVDVVAPAGDPFGPGADGAEGAHADLAVAGAGGHDPVQDARPVRDVPGQVGVEQGVDGAGAAHVPSIGQAEFLDDRGAGAVGADQVAAADGVLVAGEPVAQGGGDAVVVLDVGQVLGVEHDLGAAGGGVLDQDRFHVGLRDVEQRAGAALQVVADAVLAGAPGAQPGDLVAGEAGGEQGVAHQVPRGGDRGGFVLDAEVAQYLEGALVGDVGAGAVGQPVPLGRYPHPDPVGREGERAAAPVGSGADDKDVGVVLARVKLGLLPAGAGRRWSPAGRRRSRATSTIMSSWPPTRPRRPTSTRMSRVSRP